MINLLLTIINVCCMIFSYSQGNYKVALFNSFCAGVCFMGGLIKIFGHD